MDGFGEELRYLWRGLIRRPAFAAIVIVTLGLGVGATTTIYSVVDALLVKPLPYDGADRLVVIGNTVPGQESVGAREGLPRLEPLSFPNFADLRQRVRGVDRIAALERMSWISVDRETGVSEVLQLAAVTEGFFGLVSAKPLLGRLVLPGDSPLNAGWNVVITYQGWQRRFGGDPNVIGKVAPGGPGLTIVGVLPPDFQQPAALVGTDVEYWTYLDAPTNPRYQNRSRRNLHVLAHLPETIGIDQARRDFAAAQAQLARDVPDGNRLPNGQTLGVGINSLRDETVGSAGRPVLLFLGAAVLLLLLACTNASNLLLVRGLERARELGVRRALGAGRARVTLTLVLEGTTLAVLGGLLGLAVAVVGVGLFHRFAPTPLPLMSRVAVNPRITAVGLLLSIVVGVVIGLVPAIRASSADVMSTVRSSMHGMTSTGARLRAMLTATQLALALALGIAASLLFRSFVQLRSEPLGFNETRLVVFNFPYKGERWWEAWDHVVAALREIPGVTDAAVASNLPFQTPNWMPRVQRAEQTGEVPNSGIPGYSVTPGYFTTAGTPIVRGRAFDATDSPESRPVVIVNETFARVLLRDRDPLGARLEILDDRGGRRAVEVVGVARDAVQARLEDRIAPAIYRPHTQVAAIPHALLATTRDAVGLEADVRRAVARAVSMPLPLIDYSSMSARVAATRAGPRFHALLIGAFAATALVLSAIGLYGTLAFTVRSRTRELGIRMALGAGPRHVYRLVLGEGLAVFGVGTVAGLLIAVALTQLIQRFLYRLSAVDPTSFLLAIAAAAAAVLLAALRPAGRAARIDPMSSIRTEG